MNVFLPIKPRFAFAISSGDKKFEFRKKGLAKEVKKVVVYASSPYKRIIGYFEVKKIHKDSPQKLWSRFKKFAGIGKDEFFAYYEDYLEGVSIEIKEFVSLSRHLNPTEVFPDFVVPQSYKYLSDEEFRLILDSD